jgi:signal peptidase II
MQKAVHGMIAAAAALVIDRLFKTVALYALPGSALPSSARPVEFRLFLNEGVAFSLPLSGPLVWAASALVIAAVIAAAALDARKGRSERLPAFALFILGAASNLYDRFVYGYTVDYLVFFGRSAVNLADGMIVAGAIWLLPRTTTKL